MQVYAFHYVSIIFYLCLWIWIVHTRCPEIMFLAVLSVASLKEDQCHLLAVNVVQPLDQMGILGMRSGNMFRAGSQAFVGGSIYYSPKTDSPKMLNKCY